MKRRTKAILLLSPLPTVLLFIGVGRSGKGETLHCAVCGALISRRDAICRVMGRPPRKTYVNPHGLLCPIVTLAETTGLDHDDYSSAEHTWFSGYAWRPAACAASRAGRSSGISRNWRRTSWIMSWAALPTATMAMAEKRNGSMQPMSRPTST